LASPLCCPRCEGANFGFGRTRNDPSSRATLAFFGSAKNAPPPLGRAECRAGALPSPPRAAPLPFFLGLGSQKKQPGVISGPRRPTAAGGDPKCARAGEKGKTYKARRCSSCGSPGSSGGLGGDPPMRVPWRASERVVQGRGQHLNAQPRTDFLTEPPSPSTSSPMGPINDIRSSRSCEAISMPAKNPSSSSGWLFICGPRVTMCVRPYTRDKASWALDPTPDARPMPRSPSLRPPTTPFIGWPSTIMMV